MSRYVRNWAHCDGVSTFLIAAAGNGTFALSPGFLPGSTSENRWNAVPLPFAGLAGQRGRIYRRDLLYRLAADRDLMTWCKKASAAA